MQNFKSIDDDLLDVESLQRMNTERKHFSENFNIVIGRKN
jgi:hypothetical protein